MRVVRILSDFSNMCGDEGRAMRWKNKKQKLQYIEKICEDNAQAIKQKLPVLLELSQDKNPEVRGMLAENLVLFDCEETEEILYNMLSDQNRMVRLEAVDSIGVGRSRKSIEKVATMLSGQWSLIRMYAVLSLFDLLTNAFGANEEAFKQYREKRSIFLWRTIQGYYWLTIEMNIIWIIKRDCLCWKIFIRMRWIKRDMI